MSRITIGFYREAWLVAAQGGWWKQDEILEQLPSGCEVDKPSNRLWIMAKRYSYFATRGEKDSREYAVTPECVTPAGISVRRLSAALVGERA